MDGLNRRHFAGMLVGAAALVAAKAEGQVAAPAAAGAAPVQAHALKTLTSGIFRPQPGKGMQGGHESHSFLSGLLTAGNIHLEMHQSIQAVGAPHEAVGTHTHSEIWLVQRGAATLYLNGTEHTLQAGDVGLCCAGDEHWIANKGDTELAYCVVTVGAPE